MTDEQRSALNDAAVALRILNSPDWRLVEQYAGEIITSMGADAVGAEEDADILRAFRSLQGAHKFWAQLEGGLRSAASIRPEDFTE